MTKFYKIVLMQKQTQEVKIKKKHRKQTKEKKNISCQNVKNDVIDLIQKFNDFTMKQEAQTQDIQILKKGSKSKTEKEKFFLQNNYLSSDIKQKEKCYSEYKILKSQFCQINKANLKKQNDKKGEKFSFHLTLDWFAKIQSIWNKDSKVHQILKKTQKITYVQQMTVGILKRLKLKHWLNDQIINSYLQILNEERLMKHFSQKITKQKSFRIHLIPSYFTALKVSNQKIQRQIKKRNITDESLVVLPINQDSHWFFVVIYEKYLCIFDSILFKTSENDSNVVKKHYQMKQSVYRCIQFYEKLYNIDKITYSKIKVIKHFPQQNNSSDCGMMMLCGIKNILQKCIEIKKQHQKFKKQLLINHLKTGDLWRFCIDDIKYYRHLFVRELLEETIFSF